MTGPALLLLMPLAAWIAPGWLLSRWLAPRADALQRLALALVAGIVTVAPTTFLIAVTARITLSATLILLVAAGWGIAGFALNKFAPRAHTGFVLPDAVSRTLVLLAMVVATGTTLASTPYAVETTEVWWHCPHLASLYMIEDGSGPGVLSYDPVWQRTVPHVFQHPTEPAFGLGMVLGLQRPGNIAYLSQPLAMMSSGGGVVALWCSDFLILALGMLLLGRGLRSTWLIGGLAIVFLLGARALASYQVNENTIALALSMALLHLLWRDDDTPDPAIAVAAGCVAAHLAGIRPATLLVLPAALLLLGGGWRHRAVFGGALVLAATPWLWVNLQGLGTALVHPALNYGRHTQSLFGVEFTFHPLNWPVAEALVTGPKHPLPMLLRLPLEQLQALGAPMLAMAAAGLLTLRRRRLLSLLLWAAPLQLLLMLIVQLDYQKMSYVLLTLAPLPLLAGLGLGGLQLGRRGRVILAATLAGLLVVAPRLVRDVRPDVLRVPHGDFLPDTRDRLPEADRLETLTRASFGPYLSEELDLVHGGIGWQLLTHARAAAAPELAGAPIPGGFVTVWAALAPSSLSHDVEIETAAVAVIPPEFMVGALAPDGAVANGTSLFLMKIPAPAPATVRLQVQRTADRVNVTTTSASTETFDEPRWVSVLFVDRQTSYHAGVLSVVGRDKKPYVVTLWQQSDGEWDSQPRLVTNAPFAWSEDGFTLDAEDTRRIDESAGPSRLCTTPSGRRVLRRADGFKLLTSADGQPLAMRLGGTRGKNILGWGRGYPSPQFETDACTRRFLDEPPR